MRFWVFIFVVSGLQALLTGCSPGIPKVKFYHAEHGVVTREDARFSPVLEECGRQAYAEGLTIDGQLVTDRKIATAAWSRHVLNHVVGSGGSGSGGSNAGTGDAPASGTEALTTQASAGQSSQFGKPPFYARFRELEKQTWDCVEKQGWKRQT